MAGIRRAVAYSKRKVTAYTRKSKVKSKNYIKAVPIQKIVKFNMGDIGKYNKGGFKYVIKILPAHHIQIRDMALEAVRQMIHNKLTKKLVNNYYLACKCFPHQVLRNNRIFSGGSKGERIQSGMKHSFGTSEGRSAHVLRGHSIFEIYFEDPKVAPFIRDLCKSASPKLPCKTKISFETIK